ncbi:MAG: hypothetical protein ACI855_000069 [Myxococcota bacterium]|jgi:hypothetical protein
MHGQLTFLQLSAEFGGTKFGPFPGPEIRLGSDEAASDITLPEALGVLPQHVKILIQSDGSFIVAPTERTAAVHVYRGSGRPKHIATATALAANDSFALVTAEGPRFIILAEQAKQDHKKLGKKKKKNMAPTAEGMWAEIKRIGFTQVFRSRLGNMGMKFWTRLKSGTLFTPRVIIGFLFLSTGWIAAMGAGLAAVGGMFAFSGAQDEITEVRGDLADCRSVGEGEDNIFTVSQRILGDDEWASTLRGDDTFHEAYIAGISSVHSNADDYRWVYTQSSSDFSSLRRQAIRDNNLGSGFGEVFSYVAATPGAIPERDWYLWRESLIDGDRDCGRGPTRMTYMQARNLDVLAMPTVLVTSSVFDILSTEDKRTTLFGAPGLTLSEIESFRAANDEMTVAPVGSNSSQACVYLAGHDDRAEANDTIRALTRTLGPEARNLPGEGQNYWIASRLVRFFAAGMDLDFETIQFDGNAPTPELDELPSVQKDYIVKMAATTAARAATIRCLAVLDDDNADIAEGIVGTLPGKIPCYVLFDEAGVL